MYHIATIAVPAVVVTVGVAALVLSLDLVASCLSSCGCADAASVSAVAECCSY